MSVSGGWHVTAGSSAHGLWQLKSRHWLPVSSFESWTRQRSDATHPQVGGIHFLAAVWLGFPIFFLDAGWGPQHPELSLRPYPFNSMKRRRWAYSFAFLRFFWLIVRLAFKGLTWGGNSQSHSRAGVLRGPDTRKGGSWEPPSNFGYNKGIQVHGNFAQKASMGIGTCLPPGELPWFFFSAGRGTAWATKRWWLWYCSRRTETALFWRQECGLAGAEYISRASHSLNESIQIIWVGSPDQWLLKAGCRKDSCIFSNLAGPHLHRASSLEVCTQRGLRVKRKVCPHIPHRFCSR